MSYGSGVIRGHIMINGCLEPVQIKNVHHVPDIPHTLISPLQLEDKGHTQWRRGNGIEFYQSTCLRLFTIQRGQHIILPIRDSCKVSFVLASLMTPVITLPCVSALVAGSFMTFGSFGSIEVVDRVTGSLMEGANLVHVLGVRGSVLLCTIVLRNSCTVVVLLWLLL